MPSHGYKMKNNLFRLLLVLEDFGKKHIFHT